MNWSKHNAKQNRIFNKMNSLKSAFHFYGLKVSSLSYLHESDIFTVGKQGYFEISRKEVNGFIRKFRKDKRAYVNKQILERV